MLLKDGDRFTVPTNSIGLIKQKFHLPVRIVYPKSFIKWNAKNKMYEKPAGINIPMTAQVRTKSGTSVYRYFRNSHTDSQGKTFYTPNSMLFTGDKRLTELDIDLIFFLYFLSPHCGNGHLDPEQRKKSKFFFEDERRDAEDQVRMRQAKLKIERMLYDDEVGLSEERLRAIAGAMFISNVDKKTISEVRLSMEKWINHDKQGATKFLAMVGHDETIEAKVLIQRAIDGKVITYNPKLKTWYWGVGDRKDICRVSSGKPFNEAMYDYMMGNDDFRQELEHELKFLEKKTEPVE